jgi:hypothetical protein
VTKVTKVTRVIGIAKFKVFPIEEKMDRSSLVSMMMGSSSFASFHSIPEIISSQ